MHKEGRREREGERDSPICWFTPQVTETSGAELICSQEPVSSVSLTGVYVPKDSAILCCFFRPEQGAGSEVGQLTLELVPTGDTDAVNRGLDYCALYQQCFLCQFLLF